MTGYCSKCKINLPSQWNFCPECGKKLQKLAELPKPRVETKPVKLQTKSPRMADDNQS